MSSVSSVNSLLSSSSNSNSAIDVSSILASAAGVSTPGIDVTAAVAAALYADRAGERVWQAQQATLASQTTALTAIQTATQAISTDVSSLNSLTGPFSERTVSSTFSSIVSATAANGTSVGNHAITVSNLATTASWYSDEAASPTTTLPQASFTLTTAAGPSATFTTGSNGVNTLNDLVTAINGQSLGVTASVVTDATGSRLSIVSSGPGSASDFSVTSAPYTGTTWSTPDLSSGETLGADSFTLQMNGTTSTITTTDGETLSQLATDINGQSLGVTASVVSDSNGSHLSIASNDGSTPFTISEPEFGFSQAAKGQNANLTVDGVPVSSATNTVTGAISGVTIQLNGTTTAIGTVNLTVGANTTDIASSISQLVTDYNTAIQQVNAQFGISASTGTQGVLASDPTVRSLQQSLYSVLNYSSTNSDGTVTNLSSLGITQNSDGTLTLNTGALNTALQNNATEVQNFFTGNSLNGFANSVESQLSTYINPGSGAFTVDLNSIRSTNASLTSQISDFESIYIANQQTLLTSMYSQAEIALQQLPTMMAQIQAELGNNTKSS